MTFKTEDFRGELQPMKHISDCCGEELYSFIKKCICYFTDQRNVPATIEDAEVKSGSFLNRTSYPMLVIRNPDPSCKYFSIGIVVNGNAVSFPLLGGSAENYKYNMYEQLMQEGNVIKAALYKPDLYKLQNEQIWEQEILDCINAAFS